MEWSFVFFLNSALLGVGLAMDAFSVSMANGLHDPRMSRGTMCRIAGTFALFQAVMPMTGWVCVHTIVEMFSSFETFIPWIALALLGYIGGKMLVDGIRGEEAEEAAELSAGALLMQGVATSIDALSVGFTISEYGWLMALAASLIIAVVTFFICMAGLRIGKKFGTKLSGKASILGGMILFHGLKGYVLKTCLLAVPCAAAFMWFVGMHDYQRQRILTFLDPGNDPRGTGYHILQSRIAIGSGQLWGKGFKEGTQSQLRFLPERHSDFAVAVFGEEWGFVGCVALVTLFCLFLLSIFSTAVQAKDRFGSMLVVGVFFYFFWQIFINMGMVIGLMPVVGIPLPFISYGGSATLVNFTLLGIVLNVSMRRFMFKG